MGETAVDRVRVERRPGLTHDAETFCEAFQRTAEHYAERVALRAHGGGPELTWAQYAARVEALAGGLAGAGVGSGATVAMMLSNRPEAVLVDTAAMHLGAIPFSIYNTSSPEQVEYLLGHAECRVAVTEAALAERILGVAERLPLLERVYVVDGPVAGARELGELEQEPAPDGFDFEAGWRAVAADDVATLIYTSGTTGPPKAVELTHRSLLEEARLVDVVTPMQPGGRVISYLPMAHLADRFVHYGCLVSGASVTFVADLTQVLAAVIEVRPTSWGAVPRVWEKLKAALEAGFAAEPDAQRRAAFAQALDAAVQVVRARQAGEHVDATLAEAHARADRELFAPIRAQLGLDQVAYLVSGAAPIAPEVLEFFSAIGLPICEVWGMSELSLIATINPPDAIRIGTVGLPLPGIELALAADGELLVRGPIVMRGYRGAPERDGRDRSTRMAGCTPATSPRSTPTVTSRIVDRKKELIINAGGKNMSPANIENKIKAACPIVGSVVAIGDRRPYNTALIVLDPVAAASFAAANGLSDAATPAELARADAVLAEVAAGVARANESLSRVEQIKRHAVLPEEWQPGGDELTPTMKLKRKPIAEKYAAQIEAMYAGDAVRTT